jgi:hypothetical protein
VIPAHLRVPRQDWVRQSPLIEATIEISRTAKWFATPVVFRIIRHNVSELFGVVLSRPLQHEQEMPPTKPNPIQTQNQILTLQVLSSIASLDGTLPLPRVRPDAAITTNNSETLRHLAIKATPYGAFFNLFCSTLQRLLNDVA